LVIEKTLDRNIFSPEYVAQMTNEQLKQTPIFNCYPQSMNTNTIDRLVIDAHLAQGIPTLTPPAGATGFGSKNNSEKMINLQSFEYKSNGWPARQNFPDRWLHSDLYEVPYYYNFNFYNKILEEGDLR
jgi:hypothetical protein